MTILAYEDGAVENLGAREEVDSPEFERRISQHQVEDSIQNFLIHTEGRWTPAHAHRAALGFSRRIYANRDIRAHTEPPTDLADSLCFRDGLNVNLPDTLREDQLEFGFRFAWASKENPLRGAAGSDGLAKLARGSNLEPAVARKDMAQNGWVGIRFHRITDRELRRKRAAKGVELFVEHFPVIDECRRAVFSHKRRHRNSADEQFAARNAEMLLRQGSCALVHHNPSRRRRAG